MRPNKLTFEVHEHTVLSAPCFDEYQWNYTKFVNSEAGESWSYRLTVPRFDLVDRRSFSYGWRKRGIRVLYDGRESVFTLEKVASGCESEELQADGEDAGERRDGEVAGNRLRTMEVAAARSDKLGFLGFIPLYNRVGPWVGSGRVPIQMQTKKTHFINRLKKMTIVSMDDFLYRCKHNRVFDLEFMRFLHMQISMNNLHRKLKLGEAAVCIIVKEAKRVIEK